MRSRPDLSRDSLKIKLPNPFFFKGGKVPEERKITDVLVKRLTAPEITRMKASIGRASSGDNPQASYLTATKELIESSVEDFLDENGMPVNSAVIPVITSQMPLASAEKVFRFGLLLTRESSLFTTSYKCQDCGETTMFDLDPDQDIGDDIEPNRVAMEDYFDYYSEEVNTSGEYTFTVKLDKPILLTGKIDDESEETEFELLEMEMTWPTLGTALKITKDPKRAKHLDTYMIFEHIIRINDFDEETTKQIIKKNGHDKVMSLRMVDWNKIEANLDKYGIELDHKFTCVHCGFENEVPFDQTNFFDFLKS